MAHDVKKLKTMKWLSGIALNKRNSYRLMHVFAHLGRFYATDSYVLVCVEYPEHSDAGFSNWETVERFEDEDGHLMNDFEYLESEFRPNDWLERHFPKPTEYSRTWDDHNPIDAARLKKVLRGFEINDIPVSMAFSPEKLVISGHNKDVSIKALIMGVRR